MPGCCNCNSSDIQYRLCKNCYINIFRTLSCDGCGTKCDPSKRRWSTNVLVSPFWCFCDTCKKNIEDPNKKIQKLKEKEYELIKEKDEFQMMTKKYEIMTEGISGKYHKDRNQLENFYDIIVNIDSMKNILKGWKVKFTEEGKKHYETMKVLKKLVVGVVGNRNRGKSFLLSKLSGEILPDCSSIKTEGISIKYPKMDKESQAEYILMDSAGLENALLESEDFKQEERESGIEKDKARFNLREIAADKTLTEYFLQSFIIQKSNILLVVIGILSYNEQKLLNRIKIENKKKNGNPPLFVVHNLQTYSLKEQVQDYIKETLLNSATFKLEERKYIRIEKQRNINNVNDKYFIEVFNNADDKNLKIYHLVMAMNGTEAGNYYNEFAYEFLRGKFNDSPIHDTFPVIERVKQQYIDSSVNIMENPINSIEAFEDSEDLIKLKNKTNDGKDIELKPKKCLTDELGFSSFYGTTFEPKYSYYKITHNKNNYVCIELEIPGGHKKNKENKENKSVKCKATYIDNVWNISCKGEKIVEKPEGIEARSILGNREEGKFSLNIKLDSNEYHLKEKKPISELTKYKDGVYYFYFLLFEDEDSDSDSNSDSGPQKK